MNFCTQSDMKEVNKNWEGCNVLVTGGASFTGSYLVDALVKRGASTWVIDNLTNGKLENIQGHVDAGRIEFHVALHS